MATSITQQQINREFAKLVVAEGLPFTFGESQNTVNFFNIINPNFKKFTEYEVLRGAFNGLENAEKVILSLFQSLGKNIALSSDVWCSEFGKHFLRVTAHWIDSDWVMQRRVLDFIWLDLDDYDNDILKNVKDTMVSWSINDKVLSFTSDDVTNNPVVVEGLKDVVRPVLDGRLFHGNCVVRGLNDCVEKGWESVKGHVNMIWRGVCIVRQNFKLFCKRYGYKPKPIIFYDERKWDSIRDLLRTFIPYKDAVSEFVGSFSWNVAPDEDVERDSDDDEPYVPVVISERDWEVASLFCRLLDGFYEAVDEISSSSTPSSCVVLRQLVNVAKVLSELKESAVFNKKFSTVRKTFLKNFGKIPEIYCVAAVMDPRIKLSGCECLLEAFYQYTDNVTVNVAQEMKGISDLLQELYNLYAIKSTRGRCSFRDSASNDHAWSLISRKITENVDSPIEDLAIYLQTPPSFKFGSGNLDILTWWKKNESYPVLSSMARDLLTIPLSTLTLDSAFVLNKDKHILDRRAFELSESDIDFTDGAIESFKEQMKLCICLRDWLRADMRTQGKRELEYDERLGPYPDEEGGSGSVIPEEEEGSGSDDSEMEEGSGSDD